jgi:hypothetical protein
VTPVVFVVVDSSISARLPMAALVDGVERPSQVTQTTTYTGNTCTNTTFPQNGVVVSDTRLGTHTFQAFALSDTSIWDFSYTVAANVCSVIHLNCGNGGCGDTAVQNFGVVTAPATRVLSVCVRDWDCVDGDRVAVNFSGTGFNQSVFADQELAGTPICRSITVPGSAVYRFSMTALNGTGNKNNCVIPGQPLINTGELSISGTTIATIRWQLASGAGAISSGYVKVP